MDEKRPQFVHWKAKICCTEGICQEKVLGMCNTDGERALEQSVHRSAGKRDFFLLYLSVN